MNKTIIISLVAMFALTGCFKKDEAKTPLNIDQQASEEKNFSLAELFEQGKGMKCVMKSDDGEFITYSQGDKVRTEGLNLDFNQSGEDGYMINDGEWMDTWSGKKGTKMNMKKMEEMENNLDDFYMDDEGEEDFADWDETLEDWEEDGVDYDCKEQKIDQDLFIPPSDVVFEDMGAMMEASMEMEQSLDKLGEQFGSGEEMDMEEMQKMIDEMNFGQ